MFFAALAAELEAHEVRETSIDEAAEARVSPKKITIAV